MSAAHVTGPAHRLGLPLDSYLAARRLGLKWCWRCCLWLLVENFAMDNSRTDKLNPVCRRCCKPLAAAARARRKLRA